MLSPCSHSCGNSSFGNLNGLSLRQSVTSSPLLDVMMNPYSELASIVHLPRIFDVVSTICVAPFFSGILSLSYPDTNQIWISVRYDGWNIFPRVITLVFIRPGKVMPCLTHLPGGPIVIVSFLARLAILPWGNSKTYSISCSWWILCVSKSDLCLKTMSMLSRSMSVVFRFQKEHLKPNAKCFLLNYPNITVWVMSWNPPLT